MLVLLAAVATGAVAQTTYKVSVKEGTEDANSWTIAPAEANTTGVAAGTTVTATYSGTKKVKSVKAVKKAAVPVTAITLNKTETSIKVGATETLSVTAVAPDNATDKTYTWKTSDETKATVDETGKVTAVPQELSLSMPRQTTVAVLRETAPSPQAMATKPLISPSPCANCRSSPDVPMWMIFWCFASPTASKKSKTPSTGT